MPIKSDICFIIGCVEFFIPAVSLVFSIGIAVEFEELSFGIAVFLFVVLVSVFIVLAEFVFYLAGLFVEVDEFLV